MPEQSPKPPQIPNPRQELLFDLASVVNSVPLMVKTATSIEFKPEQADKWEQARQRVQQVLHELRALTTILGETERAYLEGIYGKSEA